MNGQSIEFKPSTMTIGDVSQYASSISKTKKRLPLHLGRAKKEVKDELSGARSNPRELDNVSPLGLPAPALSLTVQKKVDLDAESDESSSSKEVAMPLFSPYLNRINN